VVGFFCSQIPRVRRVSILPDGETLGHVQHVRSRWLANRLNEGDWSPRTEVRCYEEIMTLMAGSRAERRFTGRTNHRGAGLDANPMTVRGSDYDQISDLVLRLAEDQTLQLALTRWLQRRTDLALTTRWREVEAVAAALVERGTLDGEELRATIFDAVGVRCTRTPSITTGCD
jgi:hypothetical protein